MSPREVLVWKAADYVERDGDDMSVSDAVAQSTLDGQQVSMGAQSALRTAIRALSAYASEPRIAALVGKCQSILDPTGDVEKADRLARELTKVSKAEMEVAAELTAEDRAQQSSAVRKSQLEYLRAQSPAAAAAFERDRAA